MNFLCYNGEVLREGETGLSPLNRGLMYGDGCFDTLRAYSGKFLMLNEHTERLNKALKWLGIEFSFSEQKYAEFIQSVLKANGVQKREVVVRTQCWRRGGRGYASESKDCDWMITLSELPVIDSGYSLATVQTRAVPNASIRRDLKLTNGLNYIMAANEALQKGANDALMQTINGYVSETTIANLFWIKENKIFTPAEKHDLYPGITRQILKSLIHETEFELTEGEFTVEDIHQAEAVLGTNSIRELFAINRIDGTAFDTDHPVFLELSDRFTKLKNRMLSE